MINIKVANSLHESTDPKSKEVSVDVPCRKNTINYDYKNKIAYMPFVNAHDHLVRNWFPRAGSRGNYSNVNIWVEETKQSDSFVERSKIWVLDKDFDLTKGNAKLLVLLGMYKNIFSGVHVVQDHIKPQKPAYYNYFDIHVLKEYAQYNAISFDDNKEISDPIKTMQKTKGIIPFIVNIGEGTDNTSKEEFHQLIEKGLLQTNTLIVHGIALEEKDFKRIAEAKASICWCPSSNMQLIGKTLDVMTALNSEVNVTLGTNCTMAGGGNLFDEFRNAKRACPDITAKQLYKMVTKKAEKALLIYDNELLTNTKNLLILDKLHDDIYENILYQNIENVDLLIHQSKPIYGNSNYFEDFELDPDNYEFITIGNKEKFIIGKPTQIIQEINDILGYKKNFPYLPF